MRVLLTGAAGFIGTAGVRGADRRGPRRRRRRRDAHRRARRDAAPPDGRARGRRPRRRGVWRRCCPASTWCATRPRWWAPVSTRPTRRRTAATTTTAPRCCSPRCSPRAAGGWCWRRRWWSTARAATSVRCTAPSTRCRARRTDLDAGVFEHRCPVGGEPLEWRLVGEDAPLRPRSLYAASKAAQEHYALAWAEATGGSAVALRYHNVYGPCMPRDTPYSGVAAIFRSAIERGEPPRVYEDGGQMRDFVHVDDVAAANVAAVGSDVDGFAAFNVCSGRPVSIMEVADPAVRGARRRRRRSSPVSTAAATSATSSPTPPRRLTCWDSGPRSTGRRSARTSRSRRCAADRRA